jgi:branched-chain amino acid transport system permease protein
VGVIVGGLGSLAGVVFGALFIEYVPLYAPDILEWVQSLFGLNLDSQAAGAPAVVYGAILLAILYVAPAGVAGIIQTAVRFSGRWLYTSDGTSPPGQVPKRRQE